METPSTAHLRVEGEDGHSAAAASAGSLNPRHLRTPIERIGAVADRPVLGGIRRDLAGSDGIGRDDIGNGGFACPLCPRPCGHRAGRSGRIEAGSVFPLRLIYGLSGSRGGSGLNHRHGVHSVHRRRLHDHCLPPEARCSTTECRSGRQTYRIW